MSHQSNNITLPNNIIHDIIIANPNLVINMYRKFYVNTNNNNISTKKRKYNESESIDQYENLSQFSSYSKWFKYFQSSNYNTTLDELQTHFNLINSYFKLSSTTENNSNLDIVDYIEKKLVNINLNTPLLDEIYLSSNIKTFFKLWAILYNIGYFNDITPLKRIIIENPIPSENTSELDAPAYSKRNSHVKPLITIQGDMGYSFIIAYDTMLDRMIGFEFGGSSAAEYDYNNDKLNIYIRKTEGKRKDYLERYKPKTTKNYLDLVKYITSNKFMGIFDKPFRKLDIFNQ